MHWMTDEEWLELKERKGDIQYAHCRQCVTNLPGGESPQSYGSLEAIMDLKTGVITLGCKRHNIPVVSAMLPRDLVQHLVDCGCEQCRDPRRHDA